MDILRFLQQQGLGSRKECKALVTQGRICINGQAISCQQPHITTPIKQLQLDGQVLDCLEGSLYLALYKPTGYETSHQPQYHPSLYRLLPERFNRLGISAVGRLDVDTSGLILLSNDGQWLHRLASPKSITNKCYQVHVKHPITPEMIAKLQNGVHLRQENRLFVPCTVTQQATHQLLLTLTEGRYHQVKRMIAATGNRVEALHRLSVGAITLSGLESGQWRHLTMDEVVPLSPISSKPQ